MTRGLWVCGRLGRPHGLSGEQYLELEPWGEQYFAQGEEFFVSDRDGAGEPRSVSLERLGGTSRRPLVRADGAASREDAQALSGAFVFAAGGSLDALPTYRVGDLIGLRAHCGERDLGVVVDVLAAPAQDILEIVGADGAKTLVPLVDELVAVDLEQRIVHVREGLL